MTKSRDLGDLAQTVAVNLPTALGTAGETLVVNSGGTALEFSAASGGSMTVYNDINGTDGTPSGYTYLTNASSPSNGDLAFVTANNTVYVRAASGWRKIATVQEAPSTITGHSASYPDIGKNATTDITLSTTDPEGFDVTWSYVVGGNGTLSGSNINNSNGDTLASIAVQTANANSGGTNTITYRITRETTSIAGDFTITFTATDSQSTGTSDTGAISFEIAFVIADSHYTTLLMATDGSAGDNNDITDSSSNNHTITVNGDAHAGTFSPYRHGGYSAYMGGNGNYISTPHATSLKPSGTDDFCVSLWYWPNATPSTNTQVAGDFRVVSYPTSCNGWDLLHLTSNVLAVRWGYPNYADMNSGSTTLNIGEWNHIVYCKNDSTMSLFINGARANTTTSNIGMTASTLGSLYIGWAGSSSGSTEHSINGYITDFKLDIGGNNAFDATATSITVPTQRATLGDNTKLFACHLPYLEDGSTSDHTLSFVGGSTGLKPFGPYDYEEYDESINGGSVHHTGTGGNYLSLPTAPTIGTSDFEISMWLYPETKAGDDVIIDFRPSGTNGTYINFLLTGGVPYLNVNGAAINGSTELPVKVWSYLTLTRVSGSTKLYVNGTQTGSTYSDTNNYLTGSNRPIIAQAGYTTSSTLGFNGYMSDFIIKLSGNSSPSIPTEPVSSTGTALHIKSTDAHVLDKSQGNNLKLFNDAAAVTDATNNSTISSTNAVSFDGTGDYATSVITPINTADFTVEAWVWKNAQGSTQVICGTRTSSTDSTGFSFVVNSSNELAFYTNAYNAQSSSLNFPAQTWVHVAAVRSGTSLTLYKDGSSVATGTSSHTFSKDVMYIGQNVSTQYWNGYIQDLRVSVGKARTISVPSAPLKG